MKFNEYIKENDTVKKALALREPKTGDDLSTREKDDAIDLINQAIDIVNGDIDKASNDKKKLMYAQLADLEDKLEKYETGTDQPDTSMGKDAQDEPPDDEPPPDEEPLPANEGVLGSFSNFLNEKLPKGWDKSSVVKFGKSLGIGPGDHGFFDS